MLTGDPAASGLADAHIDLAALAPLPLPIAMPLSDSPTPRRQRSSLPRWQLPRFICAAHAPYCQQCGPGFIGVQCCIVKVTLLQTALFSSQGSDTRSGSRVYLAALKRFDACHDGCRKRRPASSLASSLGGGGAGSQAQHGLPAAIGTARQQPHTAVSASHSHTAHQLLLMPTASGIGRPQGHGSFPSGSYQPQAGPALVGHAGVTASAPAHAQGVLPPAWTAGPGGSLPEHAMPHALHQTMLTDFCYPGLLPSLQPSLPPLNPLLHSMPGPQLLPPIGPTAVRMPAGQEGAFFLPSPGDGASGAPMRLPPLTLSLQGSMWSADQRLALRGAALRQALRAVRPQPPSTVNGAGPRIPGQPAGRAETASRGSAAAAQHQQPAQRLQLMQLQSSLVNDPRQQQQQQQHSLPQQLRPPLTSAPGQHGEPRTQALAAGQPWAKAGQHMASGLSRRGPAETPALTVHASSVTSNCTQSGSLRTPSSPRTAAELSGYEALRRRLRTNSDRCVLAV